MLTRAKLSKMFWVEALMTAMYVINILSSTPLDGDTPQRVWMEAANDPAGFDQRSRLTEDEPVAEIEQDLELDSDKDLNKDSEL